MHSLTNKEVADLPKVFSNSIKNSTTEKKLHSYLVPLPKTSKDHTKLQGHYIITIQNTVGKLLENIIMRSYAAYLTV